MENDQINSWCDLGRSFAAQYANAVSLHKIREDNLNEMFKLEVKASMLLRKKIVMSSWINFLKSGCLDRVERLDQEGTILNQSSGVFDLNVSPYIDFIQNLVTSSSFTSLSIGERGDGLENTEYAMIDTVACFLFNTAADPEYGVNLFCASFSPILSRELSILKESSSTLRDYLIKGDPREFENHSAGNPIPFSRAIFTRAISMHLTTHIFLDPLTMLFEHIAEEEIDLSNSAQMSEFLEEFSSIILKAFQSNYMLPVKKILAMIIIEANNYWPETPNLNNLLIIWYIICRDYVLMILDNSLLSASDNSNSRSKNLQILSRAFESFDINRDNSIHLKLKVLCESIYSLLDFEPLNYTFEYNPSICLHTREISGLQSYFARFKDSPTRDMLCYKKMRSFETQKHGYFLFGLKSNESFKKSLKNSIIDVYETGKLTGDLFSEEENELIQNSVSLFVKSLVQIFTHFPNIYVKASSMKEEIDRILLLASSNISAHDRNAKLMKKAAASLIRIDGIWKIVNELNEEDILKVYTLLKNWLSSAVAFQIKNSSLKAAHESILLRSFADHCEILDQDCYWINKRFQLMKINDSLLKCKVKFSYTFDNVLPKNSENFPLKFEATSIQEFCRKYRNAFLGDSPTNLFSKLSSGISLKSAAEILYRFVNHLLISVKSDLEFLGILCKEEEISEAEDTIEDFLIKQLFPVLFYVIISVQSADSLESPLISGVEFVHDEVLCNRMRKLSWLQPEHLDLNIGIHGIKILNDEMLYKRAGLELKNLDSWKCRTAREKLNCLTRVLKFMTDGLRFEIQSSFPNADICFPALIIMIIRTAPQQLASNLQFIRQFRNPTRLELSEHAYCFSQFSLVQSFIMSISHDNLINISREEWDYRMSN
jgi:hypothetical protein